MTQTAPYPGALAELVAEAGFAGGSCSFELVDMKRQDGSRGLTLLIRPVCEDAWRPEVGRIHLVMPFAVPAEVRTRDGWLRWLFERVVDAAVHEVMEAFTVGGRRPFAPQHHPFAQAYRPRWEC